MQLGDARYELTHLQFRTPSEHTVAGRSFPMEIQFVHRSTEGRVAIVALLVTSGPANLAARELWDQLPVKPHTKSKKNPHAYQCPRPAAGKPGLFSLSRVAHHAALF